MKKILSFFSLLLLFLPLGNISFALEGDNPPASELIGNAKDTSVSICEGGECGLDEGIKKAPEEINGIEKEKTFSVFVQDIVVFLLSYVYLVAVLFIIYAGFLILMSAGNEEKMSKAKNNIIYVMVGIVVIYLAGPIVDLLITILS